MGQSIERMDAMNVEVWKGSTGIVIKLLGKDGTTVPLTDKEAKTVLRRLKELLEDTP